MADKAKILQNAHRYMVKGQIDKAIEEWQKLISESPNDGNIYNTIGDLLFKKNDLPKAAEAYLKGAEVFHAAGFSLKTIAIYKKLIKLVPQRLDILLKLGDLNAERGLTGNAIEDYLAAAKQYSQEGNVKEALEVYRKIADLDPSNTAIRMKLADLCLKEGLQQQAIDEFLKVAESYLQTNQSKEAEVLYARILKLDPRNETVRKLMGRPAVSQEAPSKPEPSSREQLLPQIDGAIEKGLLDKARDLLNQFMEQNPDDPVGPYKLGTVLLKTGKKDEAFGQLKKAADQYVVRSEYGQAGKLMKDYLETDPDRIEAHLKLAEVYEQGSNPHLAVSAYAHVIDEYLVSGETAAAKDLYAKIKTLEPQHRDVRRLRYTFETAEISQPRIVPPETDHLPEAAEAPPPSAAPAQPASEAVSPPVEPAPMADPAALNSLFTEAEVYLKYGLSVKAIEPLEQVLAMDPENEMAHRQLKDIYKSEGQTAKAVEECFHLIEIYKKTGHTERRTAVLEEAKDLDPESPRVREAADPVPISESGRTEIPSGSLQEKDDVSEQMAEADFYYQQGLRDEAKKMYELILTLYQNHPAALEKLEAIATEEALEKERKAQATQEVETAAPVEEPEKSFAPLISEDSIDEQLDGIFSEFQKDAEQGADDIDYESQYNLGIAYKEMGLLTEAIGEFKQAMNGPGRFIDASNMLAACYQANGNNQAAIELLERALSDSRCDETQSLWLRYDLASLYEKESRMEEALALFNRIARSERNFKDVAQRVETLERLLGKP